MLLLQHYWITYWDCFPYLFAPLYRELINSTGSWTQVHEFLSDFVRLLILIWQIYWLIPSGGKWLSMTFLVTFQMNLIILLNFTRTKWLNFMALNRHRFSWKSINKFKNNQVYWWILWIKIFAINSDTLDVIWVYEWIDDRTWRGDVLGLHLPKSCTLLEVNETSYSVHLATTKMY